MKRSAAAPYAIVALSLLVAFSAGLSALAEQPEVRLAGRDVAMPVLFPAGAAGTPVEKYAAAWENTSGWDISGLPEDKPMSYKPVTDKALVRQGNGAVRFDFDAAIAPVGMKYFRVGDVSGTDGYAFWVYGDGSGMALQVRASQSDWSAWDSPILRVDFTGWRQFIVLRDECRFHHWGGHGKNWDDIKIFALRLAEKTGSVVVDDLRFYSNTAGMKVTPIPPAEPVTLKVDLTSKLPPIPPMLKGVDFALVNWGANRADLNFGDDLQRLFKQSGAKLVRFWTFCPPLNVSPAEGKYDWTKFDAQMAAINAAGAKTIMTCCFTPTWLSVDGTKEGMPKDFDAYEKLIADTVRHCVEKGFDVAYWECWNEPNLSGGFLKGGLDAYLKVYGHFAKAVRSADPKAKVGGPGLAGPDMGWVAAQVKYAADNKLPLDFVSWHVYQLSPVGQAASIRTARGIVDKVDAFKGIDLIIDEWNAAGGPQNAYDTEFAAAFQVSTMHKMLEAGLAAQTFFAFNESEQQEFAGGVNGRNWGMITNSRIPKASFHSFRIFAELTGPRYAVTGGDDELNAIAAEGADGGVDIMIYRFQPDANAPDRPVKLEVAGWKFGQAMSVTLELVDNSHANAAYDRSQRQLKQVAEWSPVPADKLGKIVLPLRPLTVARVKIRPVKGDQNALEKLMATKPVQVWTNTGFEIDALTKRQIKDIQWEVPDGWNAEWRYDYWLISPANSERMDRIAYLSGRLSGSTASFPVEVVAPEIQAKAQLVSGAPFKPGTTRTVRVKVTDSLPAIAEYTVLLDTRNVCKMEPAETDLECNFLRDTRIFSGKDIIITYIDQRPVAYFDFQVSLPTDFEGESVFIRPIVQVKRLTLPGIGVAHVAERQPPTSPHTSGAASLPLSFRPITVALPKPLAEPKADEYTTFFSTLGSAEAIAKPAKGAGGELKAAKFAAGKFGNGAMLSANELVFPAEGNFPADVGTLELWITPQWDGKDAPGWGTLFNRSGTTAWAKSMWDVLIRTENNTPHLVWDLHTESGPTHTLSADISAWKAGEPHHLMISWNSYSGRMAMYVDGKLAGEKHDPAALVFNPKSGGMYFNKVGGRQPSKCVYGPVRISNVERVVGAKAPAPQVEIRSIGLEVKVAK